MKKADDRVLNTTRTAYGVTSASATECRRLGLKTPTSALPDTNRRAASCGQPGSTVTRSPAGYGMRACNGERGE